MQSFYTVPQMYQYINHCLQFYCPLRTRVSKQVVIPVSIVTLVSGTGNQMHDKMTAARTCRDSLSQFSV